MKKPLFKKIIWALFFLFIFIFLLNNSYSYLDPDLGWHLRVGEEIIKAKQIPHLNTYNYTINNKNWVDHEWLLNALSYWLYSFGGYTALTIFFTIIALIIFAVLVFITFKYFINRSTAIFFIIIFSIIGLRAMAPHLGVRMQAVGLLFYLLLLLILFRFEKTKNYKVLIFLVPLFYLWACSHGSFLIGLFLLFFYLSVKYLELLLSGVKKLTWLDNSDRLNSHTLLIFSLFIALSVAATLITPYRLELYQFLGGYRDTFYMTHIEEWVPINWYPIEYWRFIYAGIVATTLILITYFSLFKSSHNTSKAKINLWFFALAILFLILSFKSKRHFPLLFISTFPWVVQFFTSELDLPDNWLNNYFKEKLSWLAYFLKFIIIACFVLVIASKGLSIKYTNRPFEAYCQELPCAAVAFLKTHEDYNNLRLFNQYGWGGYLIYAWPEKSLFIDGRLPQYQFAGHTLLAEYYTFFDKDKLEDKLKQYDIEIVLIRNKYPDVKLNWFEKYFLFLNEEKINNETNNLIEYLESASEWKSIYNDEISVIYTKDKGN